MPVPAVPLAGAALIGDRFGNRRAWIAGAFVLQIVIFGAGHAAYPTQPSYARVIELIVPSTIFGLLYLRFGLLPAIVMHFAFDAVLFGIPLFVSTAPGAWVDQSIFGLIFLAPLWVVASARYRGGGWIEASAALRNEAWSPTVGSRPRSRSLRRCASRRDCRPCRWSPPSASWAWASGSIPPPRRASRRPWRWAVPKPRRRPRGARGADVDAGGWTESSVVVSAWGFRTASSGARRVRSGTARCSASTLGGPRWRVRYARFEGDVAARAEEHVVRIGPDGEPGAGSTGSRRTRRAPRSRKRKRVRWPGRRWPDRAPPRTCPRCRRRSPRRPARTDWTFTFRDETVGDLAGGEARVAVEIAGDQVVDTRRFVFLPEEWRRADEQRRATLSIAGVASSIVLGLLLVAGAVLAVVRWTRGAFDMRVGLAVAGIGLTAAVATMANNWPLLMNGLSTAQPLPLQIGIAIVGGLIGGA